MDRLSLSFFAAAVLIAGTAAAGLALRAGVGTRAADASVAIADFSGVVAGGSTREVPAEDSFLAVPVEPAPARVASAPVVRPVAKPRPEATPECTAPVAFAIALVAAVEPVPASGPDFDDVSVPPVFVPFEGWTEERKNALKATIARAGEATLRHEARRVRIDRMHSRLRSLEQIERSDEREPSGRDAPPPEPPGMPSIETQATTQG